MSLELNPCWRRYVLNVECRCVLLVVGMIDTELLESSLLYIVVCQTQSLHLLVPLHP